MNEYGISGTFYPDSLERHVELGQDQLQEDFVLSAEVTQSQDLEVEDDEDNLSREEED